MTTLKLKKRRDDKHPLLSCKTWLLFNWKGSAYHLCYVPYFKFLGFPKVVLGGLWNQLPVWVPEADTVSVFKTVSTSVSHKVHISARPCLVSCSLADSRYGPPGSEEYTPIWGHLKMHPGPWAAFLLAAIRTDYTLTSTSLIIMKDILLMLMFSVHGIIICGSSSAFFFFP